MQDIYGRNIDYLRISVTYNCNLKCIYCSPDEKERACFPALTPQEYGTIVRCMAEAGIKRVRITGGEPLIRPDVCEIVSRVAGVKGIEDISITTNGLLLGTMAQSLADSGLKRVNISLDSLKQHKFKQITGSGRLEDVISSISKAVSAGLTPVKINTVLIKGINDDEIDDFIQLTKDMPIDVRFIELMPIGGFGSNNIENIIYNEKIIASMPYLEKAQEDYDGQPAVYYRAPGHKGRIGFISPMGHKFCNSCNRIRLTCDGKIKACLGNNIETDLMYTLKNEPDRLGELISKVIYNKPRGHNFNSDFSSNRNMSMIGG